MCGKWLGEKLATLNKMKRLPLITQDTGYDISYRSQMVVKIMRCKHKTTQITVAESPRANATYYYH